VVTRLRVLDATGRPAAGATVRRGFGLKQSADAAGRCTVGRLPPGESISLTVLSRDGSQGALVQVGSARRAERPEGRGESIARLQPLPVVSGAVKDTSGRAIPEAWVNVDRLVPAGGGMSGQMPEPVTVRTADRQGRFSLPLFPGGQFRVTVEAPGYGAVDRFPVQVRRGKVPTPLRITLVRAEGEIAGAVVDPDGKPLAGARVSAGRGGATGVFVVNEETATDEQGRFRIHRLPPGVVNLAASQAGYYGDRREKVPVGAVNVRFVLAPIEEAASELSMARVGVTAPEIRVARWLNGDGVTSWTALRGKTVVLQFSSAYNRAARASNEALKALHARLREAGRNDVVILAVYDASAPADEVAAYARSEGLPFPIGLVEPSRNLGVDSAAFRAYGVRRLPALFVIDRDGILRAIDPDHEELARRLEMKAGQ
jgi:hypothetical protein